MLTLLSDVCKTMIKHNAVKRVLLTSTLGNATLCILKITGGAISGSMALIADGSDSLLNIASGIIAYRYKIEAEKPPDLKHRYGHALLEVYGSILILMLMIATFSFIGFMALNRLEHITDVRIDPIGIPFAITSLALNLVISISLRTFGRGSILVKTESRHISLDVIEGLLALSGVSFGAYVSATYDLVATFILLALITFFAIQTLKELKITITAESPPEEMVRTIENILLSVNGIKNIHDLRIRQAGEKLFADVHIEVNKELTVEEAHRICDEAEYRIKQRLKDIDIVIHVEPDGG